MDRLDYEGLLKVAYGCGRDAERGINADCFDGLISKELAYRASNSVEEACQFGMKMGEITTQIYLAVEKMIREKPLSDEHKLDLKSYKQMLQEPDITVDKICEIISRIKQIIVF